MFWGLLLLFQARFSEPPGCGDHHQHPSVGFSETLKLKAAPPNTSEPARTGALADVMNQIRS